jgi:AcrR family transcriptional regulator
MKEQDPVHKQVMKATAQTLAEDGFAGFTMRTVAEQIDASKSTLHYRYDSKEGLLATWLEHNTSTQAERFEQYADQPPLERLVGILDENLRLIENPAIDGLLPAYLELHTRAARTDAFRAVLSEAERQYQTELVDCIEDGIEQGVFRPVDPEATATLLIAVPDSAGLTQHTLGDDAVVSRLRTALNELVFQSLLVEDVKSEELL